MPMGIAVKAASIAAITAANAGITTTTLLRSSVDFILALVMAPMSLLLYPSYGRTKTSLLSGGLTDG